MNSTSRLAHSVLVLLVAVLAGTEARGQTPTPPNVLGTWVFTKKLDAEGVHWVSAVNITPDGRFTDSSGFPSPAGPDTGTWVVTPPDMVNFWYQRSAVFLDGNANADWTYIYGVIDSGIIGDFWANRIDIAFAPQVDVAPATVTYSNTITAAYLSYPVSITGCTSTSCEYRIGSGSWVSVPGTAEAGDVVQVRQTSSSSWGTTTELTLTMAGIPTIFRVTTATPSAPSITSAGSATFTLGTPNSFTVTATGTPVPSISLAPVAPTTALPAGVSFVDNADRTATLSGTPAAGTAGTYTYRLTASNGNSPDATQAFTFTVSPAGCSYAIDPTSASPTAAGGNASVTVTTGSSCPWTAASNASWMSVVSGASGTGSGTVVYSVDPNGAASRSGTITVAGQVLTVSQGAVHPGYYTIPACRLVDTRNPDGPSGGPALSANTARSLPVAGMCEVPSGATAVALNVTVVDETDLGHLRLFPAGSVTPLVSAINFTAGKVRATNAVIALGIDGEITVACYMPSGSTGRTHLVIDLTGYFVE